MVAATEGVWQTQDGVRVVVVPPRLAAAVVRRPDGDFRMLTAAQAAPLAPGHVALIDGSMFRAIGAQRSGESDTAYYRRVDRGMTNFRLVDRAAGIDVASRRARGGGTIWVKPPGGVSVQSGDAVAADAAFAVQLYPPLVRNGAVVASNVGSNAQTNWRAGIGVMGDGRLVFAVGRKSMTDFARAMLVAGARDAGYTDGGGSGLVQLANGSRYGSSENRPVPVWIAAMPLAAGAAPAPQPGGSAPVTQTTPNAASAAGATSTVVKVGAALALAIGAGVAVNRARKGK